MNKFALWMKAVAEESSHATVGMTAGVARLGVIGKGLVVEKHLKRIEEREGLLSEFALAITEAPSLQLDNEEE